MIYLKLMRLITRETLGGTDAAKALATPTIGPTSLLQFLAAADETPKPNENMIETDEMMKTIGKWWFNGI